MTFLSKSFELSTESSYTKFIECSCSVQQIIHFDLSWHCKTSYAKADIGLIRIRVLTHFSPVPNLYTL